MLRPLVQRFSLICQEANHVFHPVTLATSAVYPPEALRLLIQVQRTVHMTRRERRERRIRKNASG